MPAKSTRLMRSRSTAAAPQPGLALRAIRIQKGWTLAEVSKRTGMPISTLSKIENDRMSLSYDKLARLSAGLEVDIAELFGPRAAIVSRGAPTGRRTVTRAGEGHAIVTENYDHIYPATEVLNKRFVPIIAELRARTLEEFGEMIRHPGEEYAYILEGTVEFHTELYAPVILNKGDSVYFDSGMGHAYLAAAPGPCRVLSICSGAESQLIAAMQGERAATDTVDVRAQSARSRGKRSAA
jgi:transcriptional regulator with XRE-family HTH domain